MSLRKYLHIAIYQVTFHGSGMSGSQVVNSNIYQYMRQAGHLSTKLRVEFCYKVAFVPLTSLCEGYESISFYFPGCP